MVVSMNLRELRQLSAKHELSLNFIAKDLMLSKALYQLQNIPNLILKGGTAINRIYLKKIGKMRFSDDIDFDFNSYKKPKQAVEEINKIVKNIKDFNIAKPRIMHSTIRYDLYYTNPLDYQDKIRLKFNVKKVTEKHYKQVVNFGFVPYDSALLDVYEKEALIKHKLDCLVHRKEGKDIYDLYNLLTPNFKINKAYAKEIIEVLNIKEIKSIANAANHYIPKNLRPDWPLLITKLKDYFKGVSKL